MLENESLITKFYSSFQQLDAEGMNSCYCENPIFNNQVFGILEGDDVFWMWRMQCDEAKDFNLSFGMISLLDDEYATCEWTAKYRHSVTGRRMVSKVKAHMRIQDGCITEHTDQFDIWKWERQALGLPGWLLGWSGYFKNFVRLKARRRLDEFINQKL